MKRNLSRAIAPVLLFLGSAHAFAPVHTLAVEPGKSLPGKGLVGSAFRTMFSPQFAPAEKTMGLAQRSFLDLVENSRENLQVAFVVDGTDSMAADIESVRAALKDMITDLTRYRGDHVSFSLIVYRDFGAPSGDVTRVLESFTSDPKTIASAFEALKTETGAPYFMEVPDLGVHVALEQLPWSTDKTTSRWIVLFGDAPPYDADFNEPETGARRRYDTDLLVSLAKRRGVQISCILSNSRDEERDAYTQVLDRTRLFMNSLAGGTGGAMLDLSYPDIREKIVNAAQTPKLEYQFIGKILKEDIQTARDAAKAAKSFTSENERIRMAVLPHLPLNQISFDPNLEGVQFATELRDQFRGVPRTEVKSPVDVDRQLRRLKNEGLSEHQLIQALALRLRVDYVVWGSYKKSQGIVEVRSAVYSPQDGKKLIEAGALTSANLRESDLAGNLSAKLLQAAMNKQAPLNLVAAYTSMRDNPKLANNMIRPAAFSSENRPNSVVAGFECLEQALGHAIGSSESEALLSQAETHLAKAVETDPRNPFAHYLQASLFFNQAQASGRKTDFETAKQKMQAYADALKRAFREKEGAQQEYVKQEIVANYQLLVKRDFNDAIAAFEGLTQVQDSGRLLTALRAHWMLAGIHTGDWEVSGPVVDSTKTRHHLIQIMAHWPESKEADAIRRAIRWDESKGENVYQYFPRENNQLFQQRDDAKVTRKLEPRSQTSSK